MSMLSNILHAVFGTKAAAAPTAPTGAAPGTTPSTGTAPAGGNPPAAPPNSVDVTAILDKATAAQKEKLEWRTSIVDLMKVLGLDSSLAARKELAKDLHFDGDTNDSAKMNIWLHKQVIKKLVENGGKVPDDLK